MVGGRALRGSRRRERAASVVVPFPRGPAGARQGLAGLVPSGRSLLVAFATVVGVLLAYWGALSTSVFAVDRIDVQGASGPVAKTVRAATEDLVGRSLLSVDAGEVEDAVRALPSIAGVSVDRAFPHTLVVKVAPEKPVAVARSGRSAWLVAASGKVVREIELGTERGYPRIWLTRDVVVQTGRSLPAEASAATRALAAVRDVALRRRVKSVWLTGSELTLVMQRGPELRLGDTSDIGLKLAVAASVLPLVDSSATYVDVSVPERPVAG
jgi:cell division protein FtsQ